MIDRDPDGARHFVAALWDAGLASSALVDEAASASAIEMIQKLRPPDAMNEAPSSGGVRLQPEPWLAQLLAAAEASRAAIREGHQWPAPPSDLRSIAEPERLLPSPEQEAPREWLKRLGGAADPFSYSTAVSTAAPPTIPSRPASAAALSDEASRDALLRAIDDTPTAVRDALVERLDDAETRERWAAELSEPELARLAYLLEPRLHRVLMGALELVFSLWLRAAADRGRWPTQRAAFWSFLFRFLAETRTSARSLDHLIAAFLDAFRVGAPAAPADVVASETPQPTPTFERFLDAMIEGASAAANDAVREILVRERAARFAPQGAASPPSPSAAATVLPVVTTNDDADPGTRPTRGPTRPAFSMNRDDADGAQPLDAIYIANAGLVLTNPFLPQWCRALDLLEVTAEGKTRLLPDRFSRAVHLLQWLVNGSVATPEPLLCLNKLLCGGTLAMPVERRIEPTDRELEVGRLMLTSMLANWTIIANTSIEGLQETFLQREGRLERTSDGWRLTVQRKTVDVLIDHIPWSISTIFHSWMPEPLAVIW